MISTAVPGGGLVIEDVKNAGCAAEPQLPAVTLATVLSAPAARCPDKLEDGLHHAFIMKYHSRALGFKIKTDVIQQVKIHRRMALKYHIKYANTNVSNADYVY